MISLNILGFDDSTGMTFISIIVATALSIMGLLFMIFASEGNAKRKGKIVMRVGLILIAILAMFAFYTYWDAPKNISKDSKPEFKRPQFSQPTKTHPVVPKEEKPDKDNRNPQPLIQTEPVQQFDQQISNKPYSSELTKLWGQYLNLNRTISNKTTFNALEAPDKQSQINDHNSAIEKLKEILRRSREEENSNSESRAQDQIKAHSESINKIKNS